MTTIDLSIGNVASNQFKEPEFEADVTAVEATTHDWGTQIEVKLENIKSDQMARKSWTLGFGYKLDDDGHIPYGSKLAVFIRSAKECGVEDIRELAGTHCTFKSTVRKAEFEGRENEIVEYEVTEVTPF